MLSPLIGEVSPTCMRLTPHVRGGSIAPEAYKNYPRK